MSLGPQIACTFLWAMHGCFDRCLYTQPAVGLLRKLQEKMTYVNSSARERAKSLNLAACLRIVSVICYGMNVTLVQMVHINPCTF